MRTLLTIVAALAMLLPASAQDTAPKEGDGAKPKDGAKPVINAAPDLPKDLDGLFAALRREPDQAKAKRISQRIWGLWNTSGDDTVDLLLGWAGQAMKAQKHGAALDLLDQITVLRPDYAEGWNRRATLHFQRNDFAKSLADIERVLALEPRHYGALAGMGTILTRMERKDEALDVWYRVLALYPAMESAQKAVERLEEERAGRGI